MINNEFIVTANNVKPLLAIWPVNRYETIQNVKFVLPARADSICVSPDGCYIVAGVHENVYIWQIATGRMLAMLTKHYQPINCIKFTDDGSHFVTAGKDGQVIVWNLSAAIGDPYRSESIEPLYSFSDHALPVTDLWIGAGGMRGILVTVSTDRTCKIYDLSSGEMLLSLVFQEMLSAVILDRSEIGLFLGTTQGNIYHHKLQPPPRTREYHITDNDKINNKFSGHSKTITCLEVSLDEQTLMSGSEDCNVMTWNIQSRSLLKTLPHKGAITNAKFILTPKAMFNRELKLELITKSFQRMKENVETIENEAFEFFTKPEMESKRIIQSSTKKFRGESHITTSNDSELEKLREENAKLKKINQDLFQYSTKNVLKTK
jgi:pre-rRNA-processing protein IPI3